MRAVIDIYEQVSSSVDTTEPGPGPLPGTAFAAVVAVGFPEWIDV